jgi:hypothetical protein
MPSKPNCNSTKKLIRIAGHPDKSGDRGEGEENYCDCYEPPQDWIWAPIGASEKWLLGGTWLPFASIRSLLVEIVPAASLPDEVKLG